MNTEAAEPSAPEHVSKLYGEPLPEMPKDLYIPPDALEVYLESFEGPLDLLLYMIRRANINILDIPMAPLTAQYLEYVEAMRARNLELAAEYLLMAAMLLEIKSRMLLPRPKKVEEEEALDPRAELVRRLLEYEQMKAAAAKIDALPQAMRDYQWVSIWITDEVAERLPDVNLHDLQVAWLSLMKHAKVMQHHKVRREETPEPAQAETEPGESDDPRALVAVTVHRVVLIHHVRPPAPPQGAACRTVPDETANCQMRSRGDILLYKNDTTQIKAGKPDVPGTDICTTSRHT